MTFEMIYNCIQAFLAAQGIEAVADPEVGILNYSIETGTRLGDIQCMIWVVNHGFCVSAHIECDVKDNKTRAAEVMKYITLANNCFDATGFFSLGLEDGIVSYNVYTNLNGMEDAPDELLMDAVMRPGVAYIKWGNGLAKVLGGGDAETEAAKALEDFRNGNAGAGGKAKKRHVGRKK